MLKRTHLAIGLGVGFYFLPYVTHKYVFLPLVLLASLLPDIDSPTSAVGNHKVFRPVQWFSDHRGAIHSLTLCVLLSLLIVFFYPPAALPFFLGYSVHIIADSFTVNGVRPFWPSEKTSKGIIRTGGKTEKAIFAVIVVVDIALLIKLFI